MPGFEKPLDMPSDDRLPSFYQVSDLPSDCDSSPFSSPVSSFSSPVSSFSSSPSQPSSRLSLQRQSSKHVFFINSLSIFC